MDQQLDPNSVQGVLQQLLQRSADPARREQLTQRRDEAQQRYLDVMNEPLPDAGPVQRMVGEYLMAQGRNPNLGFWNLASAVGGEASRTEKARQNQLLRRQQLAEQEAKIAGDAVSEMDTLTYKLGAGRNGLGVGGRQPTPEQLRVMYTSMRNEASQAAKGYDWSSFPDPAAAREQWVEEYANRGLDNYLSKFSTQPLGPRGIQPQMAQATPQMGQPPMQAQATPQMGQPPMQAQATPQMGQPPMQATPNAQRNIPLIEQELSRPEVQADPTRTMILQQELAREKGTPLSLPAAVQPGSEALGGPLAAAGARAISPNAAGATKLQPVPRNIPREEAAKEGAKQMAGTYVDDYEAVRMAAAAAEDQKAAFDALAKIRPNTGMFANAEQTIGSLFSALGQNPNDPIIQNAMKTRSAEQVMNQLTNASLKAEKGVQTKSDEVRIYKEFPKTTDFQKVWDFSVKLGQERAQRKLDQRDFFDAIAGANNGTPTAARQQWNREMADDPITQYLGGKLIFRGDFIRAYENKYPDLGRDAAIQKWREMERAYRERGGRK